MAGTSSSGRRGSANRDDSGRYEGGGDDPSYLDIDPEDPPPALEARPESVRLYLGWLARMQTNLRIGNKRAEVLLSTVKAAQQQIRLEHGLDEIEKLRAMVERMERATGIQKDRAAKERYTAVTGASATTTMGRRLAPPDDDGKH
jgi:hypothetical protein